MARDPVCGMQVDERNAAATLEYEGATYYFCSEGCRARFEEDPRRFIAGQEEQGGGPGSPGPSAGGLP